MGITGLLPFLKKASREAHLRDFKGHTAAVDAYCWLHKGAFSCADKLARGEPTNGYVVYVMKQVSLLLNNGIKPIMVFDGCHLPSKSVTEVKRRENRERNRKQAKELLRQGKANEAREHFQRCVEVTSEMASEVIKACRARNIDVIVAPYEADAQLAYLNQCSIAHVVITEDSDLVVFGCKAILFKLDSNGGCVFVDQEKLHLCLNVPRDKFSFEKFRNIAIMSGCDYLPSLPGIGLGKACKFFTVTSNTDIYNVLCKIPAYLKMPQLEVTKEYREKFMQAINTFLYQLVFDPVTRTLRPLKDYPDNVGPEDFPYAGDFVGHERALQIAYGNVNVQTGETVDDFNPETYKPPVAKSSSWEKRENTYSTHPSIWSKGTCREGPVAPTIMQPGRLTTNGKEVTVATPIFRKKMLEPQENDSAITEEELQALYCQPEKRQKVEMSPTTLEGSPNRDDCADATSHSSLLTTTDKNTKKSIISPIKKEKELNFPHELCKSKNPFAKSHTNTTHNVFRNQFSAVKKFSKIKKTVIDQNTIVQSRYFSSAAKTPPLQNSSEPTSMPKAETTKYKNEVCLVEDSCVQNFEEEPQQNEGPLSPIQTNIQCSKSKAFQWSKFSHMSDNVKIERSLATSTTFKSVGLQDASHSDQEKCLINSPDNSVPSDENCLDQDIANEEKSISIAPSSQASLCSDVGSLDNESFDLTPSLSSTSEISKTSLANETPSSPPDSSCVVRESTRGSGSVVRSKCRMPGLSRKSSRSKELGGKQLSLTEMFGFKRSGGKLNPVMPAV